MSDGEQPRLLEEFKAVCYWLAFPVRAIYWAAWFTLGFHLQPNEDGENGHSIALTVLFFAGAQVIAMIRWEQDTIAHQDGEPRLIALGLYTLIGVACLGILAALATSSNPSRHAFGTRSSHRLHHFNSASVRSLRFSFLTVFSVVGLALWLGWTGGLPGQTVPVQTLLVTDGPKVADGPIIDGRRTGKVIEIMFTLAEPDFRQLVRSPFYSGSSEASESENSKSEASIDKIGQFQLELWLDERLRCDFRVGKLLAGGVTRSPRSGFCCGV